VEQIMFKKRDEVTSTTTSLSTPTTRVSSVLGSGITWKGALQGRGGVRVEGAFDGDISLRGMLVVGETGRVTCEHVQAHMVIVAGALRGDITAEKVEIRSTGRVWGDVVTAAFSTEEGAFLRGQIRMEERVELDLPPEDEALPETSTLAGTDTENQNTDNQQD
jgi:cytoskeletal protein CcmA (bactofilin family)